MATELALDPALLAPFRQAAIQRLGELGQPGLNVFDELMTTRSDCSEINAGIGLLDRWMGDKPGPLDQGNGSVGN